MNLSDTETDALTNKNVSWMNDRSFWVFYILLIYGAHWVLTMVPFVVPLRYTWSVVHIAHAAITFYFFHWVKGTPFWGEDDGHYDALTFWEQIDGGAQNTLNRKFLTLVPVVVFLLAAYSMEWEHNMLLYVNVVAVVIMVLGKTDLMHKKRILGINED